MTGSKALPDNLKQITPNSVKTVAIIGAESTGKTTLCQDLAAVFDSPFVLEFMREYLQKKWDELQLTCTWEDLLPIAQGQINRENQQAKIAANSGSYLFCDTCLFELMVYSYWYYGNCPKALEAAALVHHYDLVLLTCVDIPWIADDLRDSPNERHAISDFFEMMLNRHQIAFKKVGGSRDERVEFVANLLSER
ncbi:MULTISPECIES: AAA family ATPase [Psychrobacter]|uniref:AAA family ATPase n=1 Tax=Psychrobacter TaxID=497 RepID=UPI00146ACB5D|nr:MULTISPECIES: ATP-binding protein [Psychrobacter]